MLPSCLFSAGLGGPPAFSHRAWEVSGCIKLPQRGMLFVQARVEGHSCGPADAERELTVTSG